jgi:hypothetical protein
MISTYFFLSCNFNMEDRSGGGGSKEREREERKERNTYPTQ